jgi:arylsulfatase A-like enzyme
VNGVGRIGCRLALALASALAPAACSKPGGPNVVIIVLDTARPDRLSAYGYPRATSPFLESFAARGVRYDRAYSTSGWTLPAHASLFSGMLATAHHARQQHPKIDEDVPLLAEQLARAGYETAGFSNNPWISEASGLARGFQHFESRWRKSRLRLASAPRSRTVVAVRKWLDGRSKRRPFFLFVNLIEPHMPYQPSWDAARPFFRDRAAWHWATEELFPRHPTEGIVNRHYLGRNPLTPEEWADVGSLYDGELRMADAIARALVEEACAHGGADTVVFLVSDHGENIGDHGLMGHMFNLYDSNVRIALLVRGPGFAKGTVEHKRVQITDVYPTVLHLAGLEPDAKGVGVDLRSPETEGRVLSLSLDFPSLTLLSFSDEVRESGVLDVFERKLYAAVGDRFKMIRGSDGSLEIYDLRTDPEELHGLAPGSVDAETVRRLNAVIDVAKAQDASDTAEDAGLPQDPKMLDALRALGYLR